MPIELIIAVGLLKNAVSGVFLIRKDATDGSGCPFATLLGRRAQFYEFRRYRIRTLAGERFGINEFDPFGLFFVDCPFAIADVIICLSMLAWSKRFGKIIDAKVATDILYTDRIINASSLSVDWSRVFSPNGKVYILGNTQYVGARMRSAEQTAEFDRVFSGLKNYRDIDYSGAYIYQAAKYMREHDAEASFIVTNSLTQGSQAGTLWPLVFDLGIHISFGWQSFKLQNLMQLFPALCLDDPLKNTIPPGRKIIVLSTRPITKSSYQLNLDHFQPVNSTLAFSWQQALVFQGCELFI